MGKGNNIGYIRRSEDTEDFQFGELSNGDMVYGYMLGDDGKPKDKEVCIVSDTSKLFAGVYTARYRLKIWTGIATQEDMANSHNRMPIRELTIVPISEDWFAENSAIFREIKGSEDIKPRDSDMRVAFCYEFKARRWQATYYAVGFELSFTDLTLYDKLQQEGLQFTACEAQSRGKATIVQIVKPVKRAASNSKVHDTFTAAAVAQFIAVHELQHFLRLCGIFDTFNVPKELLSDEKLSHKVVDGKVVE